MQSYLITWEINEDAESARAALDAVVARSFGGRWPAGVDSFVVTDEDGEQKAFRFNEPDEPEKFSIRCSWCGATRADVLISDFPPVTCRCCEGTEGEIEVWSYAEI